jgi:hypothetical protein
MIKNLKQRIIYLSATIIFFVIEVLIALFINDKFIRPFVGDILVVILIYCFVRIFMPSGIRLLPLFIFLFACIIEFLQYLNFIEIIGLSDNVVARVVIGTSFDWRDILCYGIGCLMMEIVQRSLYLSSK